VFGNAPPSGMMEKFSDLLQFTTQVSRLMVTEIRRRASNKSTEAASRAIVQFLEVNQSEDASRGWMLLTTINLLASSGQYLVLVVFCFIRDRVAGAAHSAETPRHPSPQTPPPGGTQGVPRPAERHSPSSVSWAVPWASSRWDVPGTPPEASRSHPV
ncbi:hypothetical protein ILYODFUR_029142, partial [Ilyodon furcidens]